MRVCVCVYSQKWNESKRERERGARERVIRTEIATERNVLPTPGAKKRKWISFLRRVDNNNIENHCRDFRTSL